MDGGDSHLIARDIEVTGEFALLYHDLSVIEEIDDDPDLVFMFVFGGDNAGSASGNQRFDKPMITGVPLPDANKPPHVVQPAELQHLIEGGTDLVLDLNDVFEDPGGNPMSFNAVSSYLYETPTELAGSVLTITPLSRGNARISVTEDEAINGLAEDAHPRKMLMLKRGTKARWGSGAIGFLVSSGG